ncbi:hypothetical protein pb186bvf_015028 [Paramecium bursaria]
MNMKILNLRKEILIRLVFYQIKHIRVKIFQIKFYVIIAFSFNANMIQDQ